MILDKDIQEYIQEYEESLMIEAKTIRIGMKWIFDSCESPMETRFLFQLVQSISTTVVTRKDEEGCWDLVEYNYGLPFPNPCDIRISTQLKIGNFRPDFVFEVKQFDPIERKDILRKKFIVEIDGHEFHEKTKEQAMNDNKRDRELQALGFSVLRFTGSEVFKDPAAVVDEVLDFAIK